MVNTISRFWQGPSNSHKKTLCNDFSLSMISYSFSRLLVENSIVREKVFVVCCAGLKDCVSEFAQEWVNKIIKEEAKHIALL